MAGLLADSAGVLVVVLPGFRWLMLFCSIVWLFYGAFLFFALGHNI
jgi:hypothetical protein